MQRFIAGICQIDLRLTPQGPWMIRGEVKREQFSGGKGGGRDILQPLLDARGRPMLPASSLKGVLRSTAEQILRSLQPDRSLDLRPLADEPFVHEKSELPKLQRGEIADSELAAWRQSKNIAPEWKQIPSDIYTLLSPASQLFGCTLHAGLLTLNDAVASRLTTPPRSHVALDRFTGGVGEGPFMEQLAPGGEELATSLTITNFALWQIGLLALVFQELNRGYTAVGGGTRKGQGQMRVRVPSITFRYPDWAYPNSTGIVSAQVRLTALQQIRARSDETDDETDTEQAATSWQRRDIPREVLDIEGPLLLLPDQEAELPRGWRECGMKTLVVQEQHVQQLFREVVTTAWCPWVAQIVQEGQL